MAAKVQKKKKCCKLIQGNILFLSSRWDFGENNFKTDGGAGNSASAFKMTGFPSPCKKQMMHIYWRVAWQKGDGNGEKKHRNKMISFAKKIVYDYMTRFFFFVGKWHRANKEIDA